MFWENIISKENFSKEQIIKKDIIKTEMFNIVVVYIRKNQEISPHPEPYAVFFLVLQGIASFTKKEGNYTLQKDSCIFYKKDEVRGIKSHEDTILLGIQDAH